ncbi:MAG: 6-bladed beta-propeller [Rikenellaceae bacterium]|jgi:hypothetical protein|nr:6-bladed beta-propeller [Rikenellaceae bacterium]
MKNTTIALLFSLCLLAGCGQKTEQGAIPVFDVASAIETPQPFDLTEIAESVEFIALDSQTEALVGEIRTLEESKNGFYIHDGMETPVKFFDKTGKFHSTRGGIGRGPGEFNFLLGMAVDYESDNVYLNTRSSTNVMRKYDSSGRQIAEAETNLFSVSLEIVCYDGQLIVMNYPYVEPDADGNVPLLYIFTSDLEPKDTLKIPHKATSDFIIRNSQILSNNGQELLIKEELNDTLFYYRKQALVPAYTLDMGKYYFSEKIMWDLSMEQQWNNYYSINNLYEGSRYLFVMVKQGGGGYRGALVFDKNEPSSGFTAADPKGRYGLLFVGGLKFTPMYIRDNQLVGYMQALDIVDNAEHITDPDLKALAATLTEDDNPVIVVAKLKE